MRGLERGLSDGIETSERKYLILVVDSLGQLKKGFPPNLGHNISQRLASCGILL